VYLREIGRQDVDGFLWFTYGPLMGFCDQGNKLPVFINSVEFVDKLSCFAPCSLVTLVKAVLLPEDYRQEVCAGTLMYERSSVQNTRRPTGSLRWDLEA